MSRRDGEISNTHDHQAAPCALRLVWNEDTNEERTVERGCQVCGVTDLTDRQTILSPSGVAHFQGDDGMETMRCGANGAADGWWWPC